MVCVKVSKEEIRRGDVLSQVLAKKLSRQRASSLLKISLRQLDRLKLRYKERGLEGLIHGNRGKPSNNAFDPTLRGRIVKHIGKNYQDFGPTLAKEKLAERQRISVSKEKLRQIMKEEGFWKAKKRKVKSLLLDLNILASRSLRVSLHHLTQSFDVQRLRIFRCLPIG